MKTKILTTLLLAAMLLITACSGGSNQPEQVRGAFQGGSQGLEVTFEPLSYEEDGVFTIFDTESFSLDIILNNKGEEDIEVGDVRAKLLGPDEASFSGIASWDLTNQEAIPKISEFNPDGGEEVISFATDASYAREVVGFTDVTWNVEYEYDYKTHLIISDVCFKGDVTDDRVCDVKQSKRFSASSAPITITSVEEDTGGRGIILLKINIRNTGDGDATISGEEFDNRFSKVSYTIDEPATWECKSGGRVGEARLVDGTAQIICRLAEPLAEDDLYTRPVQLTFDYVYRDLIAERLRIKQSSE